MEPPTNLDVQMWSAIYLFIFFAFAHSPAFDFQP